MWQIGLGEMGEVWVFNPREKPPFFCHLKSCESVWPGLEGQYEEGKDYCLGSFLYNFLYRSPEQYYNTQ